MKIGLIGVGYWGKKWKELLKERGVLYMTCDKNGREDTKNPKDVFKACEAVVIAAPPYTHFNLTRDALRAGLHVLCEKPLEKEIELKNLTKNVLLVGYQMLFSSDYIDFKKKLKGIRYVQARWIDQKPGKDGVLDRLAPHPLSIIRDLMGDAREMKYFGDSRSGVVRLFYNDIKGAGMLISLNGDKKERTITAIADGKCYTCDFTNNKENLLKKELDYFIELCELASTKR
jgi:predicted dehydrogenase